MDFLLSSKFGMYFTMAILISTNSKSEGYLTKDTIYCSSLNSTLIDDGDTARDTAADENAAPLDTNTRKTEDTSIVPAPSDLIATARKNAKQRQGIEYCKNHNATIKEKKDGMVCTKSIVTSNSTHTCKHAITFKIEPAAFTTIVDQKKENVIFITGNTVGFMFLAALFTTYICFDDLQTSYGKCIVILSILVIGKNTLQVLTNFLKRYTIPCKIVAVALHWLQLSMFCWMASIGCDLFVTFSRIRLPSPQVQKRKAKRYTAFSFITPSLIVLFCLAIDLNSTQLYGSHRYCFISQKIAYIISFVIPVSIVLCFNAICLVSTIYFIRSANKASKNKARKPSISFTIMAIKLSLLLGLGWVIGYIGVALESTVLLYTFLFLDSFQGVLVYIAFCCNARVLSFYKRGFSNQLQRIGMHPSSSTQIQEISSSNNLRNKVQGN